MGLLKRKELLQREKLEVEKVDLGSDEFVFVRQMTGRERDQFERSLYEVKEDEEGGVKLDRRLENFRSKLAVCTMCDEEGGLLLKAGDVDTLSDSMSAKRLEKIIIVAQRLNKITEKDQEALVKNSSGGQAASSNSASAGS